MSLLDALKAQHADQPDKPEYATGAARGGGSLYVSVDRVGTEDEPHGLDLGRKALSGGTVYIIPFPRHMASFLLGSLGAALTDDEWDDVVTTREALREEQP